MTSPVTSPEITDQSDQSEVETEESVMKLNRPWKIIRKRNEPETCFVLARRNYKIRAHIGTASNALLQYQTVLDTGASSSFVNKSVLSSHILKKIQPMKVPARVKTANNKRLPILGTISLYVQVGSRKELVKFYVAEGLAVEFILGCDFCDKHVEAIRPRRRHV